MSGSLKKSFRKTARSEKGVALIFTLGILGLLIVLALGFASTAITERKSASNSNSGTTAEYIAQSGLARVLGALNYYSGAASGFTSIDFVSKCTGVMASNVYNNSNQYDWLWKLNGNGYDVAPSGDLASDTVRWQFMDNGMSGSGKELIGRYAYVVLPNGKLDPSACVDSSGTKDEDELYTNRGSHNGESRVGVDPTEMNIHDLEATPSVLTSGGTGVVKKMSAKNKGNLPQYSRWVDFNNLFSQVGITTDSDKESFYKWFQMPTDPLPEAYFSGTNLYHRFNLARTDWDSVTVAILTSAPNAYAPSGTDTGGILWLHSWASEKGSFDTVDKCKNQIAANLKDYCDSDSLPTSDSANWAAVAPTYTGNEKTPYINEIDVELAARCVVAPPVAPSTDNTYTITITPTVKAEIVDIYGVGGSDQKVYIYGKIDYKVMGMAQATIDFSSTPITIDLSGSSWTSGYKTGTYSSFPAIGDVIVASPTNDIGSVTDMVARIEKVILKCDDKDADYSTLYSSSAGDTTLATVMSGVGTSTSPAEATGYFSYQVADPRQNLNYADWGAPATGVAPTVETFGSKNSGKLGDLGASSADYDIESASDPAYLGVNANKHLSTAYIRNAPIQSPWELGCIHRGNKWQTLNLTRFNEDATPDYSYSKGDANILDQIKMSSSNVAYGKINVNTTNTDVLRALFKNIYVGVDDPSSGTRIYDDPGKQTASHGYINVSNAYAEALAGHMKACRDSSVFSSRAAILRASNGMRQYMCNDGGASDIGTLGTKAEREALIGKIVNLTDTDNLLTVVVIAQSIKDVGGTYNSGSGLTFFKDWTNDGDSDDTLLITDTSARDVERAGVCNNAGFRYKDSSGTYQILKISGSIPTIKEKVENCFKGKYDLGADKITGEVKILATLRFDKTTKKWKIIRLERPEN